MKEKIVAIVVGLLLVALLVPIALSQFFSADTTGWDSKTVIIWGIVPILALVGLALHFLGGIGKKGE